jgi:hypothetical protein
MTQVCSSIDAIGMAGYDDVLSNHHMDSLSDGSSACPRSNPSLGWFLDDGEAEEPAIPHFDRHGNTKTRTKSSTASRRVPGSRSSNVRLSAGAIQKRLARQKYSQLIQNLRNAISGETVSVWTVSNQLILRVSFRKM